MALEVGIVGLPNAGKSTLFNALLGQQVAKAENYPFCTIEPNTGVVAVPDENLAKLAEIEGSAEIVPAAVKFIDIAGLVSGAAQGEGLGNKFLSHIREVDVICYVLRDFSDPNVEQAGAVNPESDFQTLKTELMLKDLQSIEDILAQKPHPQQEEEVFRYQVAQKARDYLEDGQLLVDGSWEDKGQEVLQSFFLLTTKPYFLVLNIDEQDYTRLEKVRQNAFETVIPICAKIEAELAELGPAEKEEYLQSLGLGEFGLKRLIKKAYETLGLISFYTVNEKEAHAWPVKRGTPAIKAAGVVHSDFADNFIKAEVVKLTDFFACGGWQAARRNGKTIFKGRDYQVQDDEVIEFHAGQ